MTYDFDNMVSHTCQSRQATEAASDVSVCIDVEEEMKAFVDELAEQDIAANKFWTLAYKRFSKIRLELFLVSLENKLLHM
ncbi:hypothetical protein PC129_g16964 [Phytophthora cactorum]|uniref:Uncharacterized protein n=1 Tax=Phytophthora cactorum TaxID=29920 RepID=A0A329SC83_9STRA|nr:hypothetical protein PC112_g17421 [Phytophthora cactorum]KAG2833938.1 hypothetical protein PC111_g6045 [Phytophthora cactorum]KAG2845280.1 hypothetical protein PC113_g18232 [Phytophthora cactorum]KAG2910145.1 hypothetical protein PC114_g9873 [Phytophthora cactorum]KAG2910713.1 hypothetical protein PC117_g19337 [Phytophthora cactorum]